MTVNAAIPAPVMCDCHGTQFMAVVRDGKLVIRIRKHGEYHTVALQLDSLRKSEVDCIK
jgi:gamma-glutamyl-gamma-aminobutyrate hydrolase PuuD